MFQFLLLTACIDPSVDTGFTAIDRQPGDRAPLCALCDDQHATRCLLPWPANTYTIAGSSTVTGLSLAIQDDSLPGEGDNADFLDQADGFSRVTPVATAFSGRIDASFLDGLSHGDPRVNGPTRATPLGGSRPWWRRWGRQRLRGDHHGGGRFVAGRDRSAAPWEVSWALRGPSCTTACSTLPLGRGRTSSPTRTWC